MRHKVQLLAALFSVALLVGCIEFERQTLTYTYDAPTDTLKIFQDYHGIFGADDPHQPTSSELEQLDSVLKTQRTFFFGNWITEINHDQLRDLLKQFKDPEYQKQQKLEPPAAANLETLVKLLLENVHIENGPFYLDAGGKLSAVQRVTITKTSKLIAAGNVAIRDWLNAKAGESETAAEEQRLYRKSAQQQQNYIKLDGNRLTVRVPATQAKFDKTVGDHKQAEEFKKSGGSITFTNDEITLSIGRPADKLTSM